MTKTIPLLLLGSLVTSSAMKPAQMYAQVIVPAPLKEPLLYSIPESLKEQVIPGMRVLIPLRKRTVTGIVYALSAAGPTTEAKAIIAALDDLPILDQQLLKLARWISQYYLTSLSEVVAAMLPPNWRRESQRIVTLKRDQAATADDFGNEVLRELERLKGKSEVKRLARRFPGQSIERILTRLQALGAIEIDEHLPKQRRRRFELLSAASSEIEGPAPRFVLSAEQDNALGAIGKRIEKSGFETFLLHGVTGSGKTEVYLRAMERAKETGRRSLILIPEISLTPQLLDRLNARFPEKVGVLHSALTDAERWAQWRQIAQGKVDIVVGARSAVFAPVPNL